jgi:hypothetical protein
MAIPVVLLHVELNAGAARIADDRWQLFPLWSFLHLIGSTFATVRSVVNCMNNNIVVFTYLFFSRKFPVYVK